MIVLVDIDSTINNMEAVLIKELNHIHDTHYTVNDIKEWDWYQKAFGEYWYLPLNMPSFWEMVEVNSKAVETLENIAKKGWPVKLVTSSFFHETLFFKLHQTLSAFNPTLINENNVIVTYDKSYIYGDFMIDDKPEHLQTNQLADIKLLYSQPWNENIDDEKLIRCYDWKEIDIILNSFL